ncbi:MAG TPA: pyridoxamine 5'-phosphate oxidase [Nitrospirae bacterium]|nr:pyridoxamine 5'-phosphate oxidase [bacterium BMS3Abin10]GBE38531.1 pyridoxamine 5'-phosphate oxidase [bacterium BMS3Bbin08]HDH50162.1 pyridoxamine 5'-phosphate oxidase [Nitrospirota bacterium]HDK17153.1 pyridoxamine 5'-phosphate oxidase [Nitrospirota bacterium]HDO25576.1 pyridoxamine 5'-phosphate oxidase [Nitrospirota bacterium]
MSINDVISFARENPVCGIATMDDDQPRVRAFLTVLFDDNSIYFTTASTKNVFRQLMKNPKVELCYCTQDFSKMMRIAGKIEVIDDPAKKQQLINERDYLKGFTADDPKFKLLRLSHGHARFWTLENNTREDGIEVIKF